VLAVHCLRFRGGSSGAIGAKTYESNLIHHDFVPFRKKHSRYMAIFPSTILPQRWSIGHFISLTVVNPQMRLDYQILLKSFPLNLLAGSDPAALYSMLWKEREKWHCSLTIVCETSEIYYTRGFFNSNRVTIPCYIQSPNEVVNRNSVVRMS